MILLKGFFRKKTTKIYLTIFIVLSLGLIVLFSFINYFYKVANDIFQDSSFLVVASETDYYNLLSKDKNVSKIEKIVLLKPDYDYNVLGKKNRYVHQDSNLIDSQEGDENIRITWDDFYIGGTGDLETSIFVLEDDNLINNEISLGIDGELLKYENYFYKDINEIISDMINQKIGLYNNKKEKLEFTIKSTYENYFSEMRISSDIFNKIAKESSLYAYKVTINDYKKAITINNKLEKLESNKGGMVTLNQREPSDAEYSMSNLRQLIESLTYVSVAFIIIFSIIFLIVIRNIIKDEYKNIDIERLLGFNKREIKKYLCLKTTLLTTITFFIATVISIVVIFIINNSLHFELGIIHIKSLLILFCIMLFVTLFLSFFSKLKTSNNLRNSD